MITGLKKLRNKKDQDAEDQSDAERAARPIMPPNSSAIASASPVLAGFTSAGRWLHDRQGL